mmetsp:Transcript_48716/g.150444  ORF Transcript_48716/g.150444 Transcript_48716/m.150444 type:complete len:415 (-) Transcript_48716:144-1388(-)
MAATASPANVAPPSTDALVTILAVALAGAAVPWLCISLRGPTASAWGAPSVEEAPIRPIGSGWERQLSGGWAWITLGLLAVVPLALLHQERALSYCLCWLPAFLVVFLAWRRVGVPNKVSGDLLAAFALSSGLFGALFSMLLESLEQPAWLGLSPECNMMKIPPTFECNTKASMMWVLCPGLIEETGKALFLFYRLRRRCEDIPARCCCDLFRAAPASCCGWWYKLAPTPYHVILCALAAGAGFECIENVLYVLAGSKDALQVAVARAITSGLHVVWTGLIGWGLAQRLFCAESQRPSLLRVILPPMLLHGVFDYSLSAMASLAKQHHMEESTVEGVAGLMVFIFLVSWIGSCCALACLTGLSLNCQRGLSCCCSPGCWEARFSPVSAPPLLRAPLMAERPVQGEASRCRRAAI